MASPTHPSHFVQRVAYPHPYRRSSFNGAKQLSAAQAPQRRVLLAVGLLAVALVVATGIIAYAVSIS